MRLTVFAIGRLSNRPEQALVDGYVARIRQLSSQSRLGPCDLRELDVKVGDRLAESTALLRAVAHIEVCVVLDERGGVLSSEKFSSRLADWRDQGVREVAFLIGGADGHSDAVRQHASSVISFGSMVWPHSLARVMLLEQLYRAATIAVGHPYHRASLQDEDR